MELFCCNTTFTRASQMLLVSILFFAVTNAFAVDNLGLFQLDGNAVDTDGVGDDWQTLCDPTVIPGGTCQEDGSGVGNSTKASVYTGLNSDPAPATIFTGGRKDIQEISQWGGKDGAVPDKGDITNAQAAAYICDDSTPGCDPNDLIVYFQADRIANAGDTFMGFWFFKDAISYDPDTGEFSGEHQPKDTLVLVNFPQANNAVPLIQVVEWDPNCSKADSSSPQPGDCAAQNLRLVFGASGAGAVCDPGDAPGAQDACAIANDEDGPNDPTASPWAYTSKDGFVNEFPYETFFSGGINLSRVIGGDSCFASFMAETRSSSSFTASLKDFVLDSFPLCAVEISKDCSEAGAYDAACDCIKIPYSATVTNTGVATVSTVTIFDDDCGVGAGTTFPAILDLAAGESETVNGNCEITDTSGAIVNGASATAFAGTTEIPVIPAKDCTTDPGLPGVCLDPCAFSTGPDIAASKDCKTALLAEDGVVKVKVNFSGSVSNTSNVARCKNPPQEPEDPPGICVFPAGKACDTNADCVASPVPLINVAASDDKAGDLELLDGDMNPLPIPVSLDPGDTAYFKGSYLPDGTGLGFSTCPQEADFMDTVTAAGSDAFTGTPVGAIATADCNLCVDGECP